MTIKKHRLLQENATGTKAWWKGYIWSTELFLLLYCLVFYTPFKKWLIKYHRLAPLTWNKGTEQGKWISTLWTEASMTSIWTIKKSANKSLCHSWLYYIGGTERRFLFSLATSPKWIIFYKPKAEVLFSWKEKAKRSQKYTQAINHQSHHNAGRVAQKIQV